MLIGISGYVYIYSLSDPITKEVRYIGKTRNLKQRRHNHLNSKRDIGTHKRNWILSLRKRGLLPISEIVDEVPEDKWQYWEMYWIQQFKVWGFNLVNSGKGGEGMTKANKTSFKAGQIPWNFGTGKPKVYTYNRGKVPNSIKNHFKRNHIPWNKNKPGYTTKKSKPVLQLDLKGNVLKEYRDCKQAAEEFGCDPEAIRHVCFGRSKTSQGYKWKYK